jgi:hypothetical protein
VDEWIQPKPELVGLRLSLTEQQEQNTTYLLHRQCGGCRVVYRRPHYAIECERWHNGK